MILEALAHFLKDPTDGDTSNAKRQDARRFVFDRIKEINASRRPRDTDQLYQITLREDRILTYNDLDGEADIVPSFIRLIVWGKEQGEAATMVPRLNDQVRLALTNYRGMMGDVEVLGITRDLQRDEFPTAPKEGGDEWRHARWVDLKVTHTQPVTY